MKDINNNYPELHHSPTHKGASKFHEKYIINKNEIDYKLNNEDNFKHSNTIKKLASKKSNNTEKYKIRNKINRRGSDKLEKKFSRFNSFRKNLKTKNSMNNSQKKIKRRFTKKKLIQVYKKLDTISKNIENTNNAINNPNEFYMNFFNNIIKNKTFDNDIIKEEPKKEKVSNTFISINN